LNHDLDLPFFLIALLHEPNMIFKARDGLTKERRRSQLGMWRLHIRKFLDGERTKEGSMSSFKTAPKGPITLTFELLARPASLNGPVAGPDCPECSAPLDLHQPDENRPSHLLGTCGACSRWFFIVEIDPDWSDAVLFELPSADAIREMVEASDATAGNRDTATNSGRAHGLS
jgi:hypothetical protein